MKGDLKLNTWLSTSHYSICKVSNKSKMGIYRRPVSARRSVKSRKAQSRKMTYTPPRSKARSNLSDNRGTSPQGMVIHRGVGMPDRFRTRLEFSESIVLSSFGTAITQFYGIRMNGAYDPVLALGGGQPTYWDYFSGMYGRYNVLGSKISVKYGLPLSTTAGDGPYHVGILGTRGSSLPTTDSPTLATSPNCVHTMLVQGGEVKTLTQTYTPKQITADGSGEADTNTTSLIADVPLTPYNALVWASPQGPSTVGSVNVIITVEYYMEFYNLTPIVDV